MLVSVTLTPRCHPDQRVAMRHGQLTDGEKSGLSACPTRPLNSLGVISFRMPALAAAWSAGCVGDGTPLAARGPFC